MPLFQAGTSTYGRPAGRDVEGEPEDKGLLRTGGSLPARVVQSWSNQPTGKRVSSVDTGDGPDESTKCRRRARVGILAGILGIFLGVLGIFLVALGRWNRHSSATVAPEKAATAAARNVAPEGLADVAVVYVSGRPEYRDAVQEATLQFLKLGAFFMTHGKEPDNFIQALDFAENRFPNASWYFLADDDSFLHLARLAHLAASRDPKQFAFIGHRDCKGDACGSDVHVRCRRQEMRAAVGGQNPGWACGGPGVLLSAPLVKAMVASNCHGFYGAKPNPVCCGDMALSCCAFDVWESLTIENVPELSPYPDLALVNKSSGGAIAVHKIKPDTIRTLGKLYNAPQASTMP